MSSPAEADVAYRLDLLHAARQARRTRRERVACAIAFLDRSRAPVTAAAVMDVAGDVDLELVAELVALHGSGPVGRTHVGGLALKASARGRRIARG